MGVPQGFNKDFLWFLIIIIDNFKSSSLMKFNLIADDTSIYLSVCNEFNLYNIMNVEIEKACKWISANKWVLNTDRTVYLLSSDKKKTLSTTNQIYVQ